MTFHLLPPSDRLPQVSRFWFATRDGDSTVLELHERHYSKYFYKDGRKPNRCVGPGERIVLLDADGTALFIWRKFRSMNHQEGINCSVFRNEGTQRSSELILDAETLAAERWPGERFYTYVNPRAVRPTNQPGWCFIKAGWKVCGITKTRKLLILEKVNQ